MPYYPSHLFLLICLTINRHNKFSMQSSKSLPDLSCQDLLDPVLAIEKNSPSSSSAMETEASPSPSSSKSAEQITAETTEHEDDNENENEETANETPMDTESPDSGHDSSLTSTLNMAEEEVSAYLLDLEKRLRATENLSGQNRWNLLTVNSRQQALYTRVLHTEREEIKG